MTTQLILINELIKLQKILSVAKYDKMYNYLKSGMPIRAFC